MNSDSILDILNDKKMLFTYGTTFLIIAISLYYIYQKVFSTPTTQTATQVNSVNYNQITS